MNRLLALLMGFAIPLAVVAGITPTKSPMTEVRDAVRQERLSGVLAGLERRHRQEGRGLRCDDSEELESETYDKKRGAHTAPLPFRSEITYLLDPACMPSLASPSSRLYLFPAKRRAVNVVVPSPLLLTTAASFCELLFRSSNFAGTLATDFLALDKANLNLRAGAVPLEFVITGLQLGSIHSGRIVERELALVGRECA